MVNDNDIKLASVGGSAEQANDVKTVMRAARTAYNNGDMIVTPNWDVYFVENGSPVLKGNIKGATGTTGAPGKDGSPGAKGDPGENGASAYPCTSVIDSNGSTLVSSIIKPTGRSIAVGDILVSTNNGGVAQVDSASGNNVNYTYVGSIKGTKGDTGAAGQNGAPGSKIYFGEV
jgi:hypothetical glycine-rich protein